MFGGGVWPVVQRELRETARRPINHWLRVAGAGLAGAIFCFALQSEDVGPYMGNELFNNLHIMLVVLVCVFVPAITADCIAQERREGTLGLLFMTPLTASAIVIGKVMARVLRAFILWLAVMPMLTIPFVYGGITWANVGVDLMIELCVGMLCLAAGVLASCMTRNRPIALTLAFIFMGTFMGVSHQYRALQLTHFTRVLVNRGMGYNGRAPYGVYYTYSLAVNGLTVAPVGPFANPSGVIWSGPMTVSGGRTKAPPASLLRQIFSNPLVGDGLVALMLLLVSVRFAGWTVERSWQDKPPSIRQQHWVKRYCTPIFLDWFAGRMRRALERNPIAWLQQYSWKARIGKWGLCILFLLLDCFIISENHPDNIQGMLAALLLVLAAAYTYAGVNGFLQEKKSGALELILVSPITVKDIIFGRAWGLWKQFLPATALLVGSYIATIKMIPYQRYFGHYGNDPESDAWLRMGGLELAAVYLLLPIIATYCALRFKNLYWGAACTWIALGAPLIACVFLVQPVLQDMSGYFSIVAGNCILFAIVFSLLDRDLAHRSYEF